MPLTPGSSNKVVGENISEMMGKFHATGTIGNTHPQSAPKAHLIAIAAAMRNAKAPAKEPRK